MVAGMLLVAAFGLRHWLLMRSVIVSGLPDTVVPPCMGMPKAVISMEVMTLAVPGVVVMWVPRLV